MRLNDQTLKDIDRAFKALEERDELLGKIRAEIEEKQYTFMRNCNTCGQKCAIKYHGCSNWMPILESYKTKSEHKRTIDADELLKRISEKCKTPSLSEDTVNGLCGATAIIYDMLNESEQELLMARLCESGQECD